MKSRSKGSITDKPEHALINSFPDRELFDRVVAILEQARNNVVRSINSNMVIAYWLIRREIVQEIQEGAERAAYGKQVIPELSHRLTARYGGDFSVTNLKYFRTFYQVYANRLPKIGHPVGDPLDDLLKGHPWVLNCLSIQKIPWPKAHICSAFPPGYPGRTTEP